MIRLLLCFVLLFASLRVSAFPAGLLSKSEDWFKSAEGVETTACILSWQSDHGSWPKNQDNARNRYSGDRRKIKGTFDNGSTTDELRFLACAYRATNDSRCEKAFLLGLDHILEAQYPNGGWPQYFPLSQQYHRHITFNDNSMIRILEFLRESGSGKQYDFIGGQRRSAAGKAFARGVDCILKCQFVRDGKPTVWCAQHDEITLRPAMARSYELESLSGSESGGILKFLMSIENPSPEVIRAVKAGVEWFNESKVTGLEIEKVDGARTAVSDPAASALWARFYDLETNRPFFCDRDGVKHWNYNEIGKERRNGYAWYGNWGESVLKTYAEWPHR
jgi:PelA/Pel-15E family pectate lyase